MSTQKANETSSSSASCETQIPTSSLTDTKTLPSPIAIPCCKLSKSSSFQFSASVSSIIVLDTFRISASEIPFFKVAGVTIRIASASTEKS